MDTNRSRLPALPAALLVVAALLVAACAGDARPPHDGSRRTLLILHTNDLHSHLEPGEEGGLARIAGYVEGVRARRNDVLLLDAGDAVAGTPVSSLFEGRPVFTVMNVMGYDAMTLGNHEFDYGWPLVDEYAEIAAFPLLCANVRAPDGRRFGDAPFRVFTVNGIRVGVVGLVTDTTPEITAGGTVTGCEFEPPAGALARILPDVERESDIVVVLSHLGLEQDKALAAAVPGIDVIVGGHSHSEVLQPLSVGATIVAQAYRYGARVGRLDLEVDVTRGVVVSCRGELIAVDDNLPSSPAVRAAVAAWEEPVRDRVDVVIGRADRDWSKAELATPIEAIYRERLGTDLGYHNRGGIRATVPAGDVTIRRIWNVLPFENTLVTLSVRGANLPRPLLEQTPDHDPDRVYTVATNSFVAAHLDRYFPAGVESVEDSGVPMRDAVIEAVRSSGRLP